MIREAQPRLPILLIDDEKEFLTSTRVALASGGLSNVILCDKPRNALDILRGHEIGVVMLDLLMPDCSGEDMLALIVQEFPQIPVVMMTAVDETQSVVRCIQSGAVDYLVKPVDRLRLLTTVKRVVELRETQDEYHSLKQCLLAAELERPELFADIITRDPAMHSLFRYVESMASSPKPVLVTGETGVGKELFARLVHEASGRAGELVAVNVPSLGHNMFEDALFGHCKGAFTDAGQQRAGLIEKAAGGSLLLDEIGDLSRQSQVKLLRLIQDGEYYAVGSDARKVSDARIIACTNRDLDSAVACGELRRDLFYRLATHRIHIPPLRERKEDLAALLEHFLRKSAATLGKPVPTPPKELTTLLGSYSFPGNVRELEAIVFDAVSCHESGVLSMRVFVEKMGIDRRAKTSSRNRANRRPNFRVEFAEELPTLKDLEKQLIEEALARSGGNQTTAAQLLGISRQALNNRLRRAKSAPKGVPHSLL